MNLQIYRNEHHQCEECGSCLHLLVHHIDEDRSNNELSNFRVVCTSCHAIIHNRIRNIKKIRRLYETSPYQLTFNFQEA